MVYPGIKKEVEISTSFFIFFRIPLNLQAEAFVRSVMRQPEPE